MLFLGKRKKIKALVIVLTGFMLALGVLPAQAAPQLTTSPTKTNPSGVGYGLVNSGKYSFWLGTQGKYQGWDRYCIQFLVADPGENEVVSVTDLDTASPRLQGFELTTAQAAYLLEKYNNTSDPLTAAAISYLIHANFEIDGKESAGASVDKMRARVAQYAPQIAELASKLREESVKSAVVGYEKTSASGEGKRRGFIKNIAAQNHAGENIAGVPVTLELTGPAVFVETGSANWSGVTRGEPFNLEWKATGNGEVKYKVIYKTKHGDKVSLIDAAGNVQKTLVYLPERSDFDPEVFEGPGFSVVYDFRPVGVSQVVQVEVSDGFARDTLVTGVDESYGSGAWLEQDAGGLVPVVYRATAYFAGRERPVESEAVPAGAKVLGSVLVKASGPGEKLEASVPVSERGFVTWVWEVKAEDQGEYGEFIHAGWSDKYGLDSETSREVLPFRPVGVSHVESAKVVDAGGKLTDSFVPEADKAFFDGQWTRLGNDSFDEGEFVPVNYRATAYFAGRERPVESEAVPASAKLVKSVLVKASAPGEKIFADAGAAPEKGFYTWVWEVKAEDQDEQMLKFIDPGFTDRYGLDDETTSVRYEADFDSALSIRQTKSGTYLVDDLWVKGMPDNHPNFNGGKGFKADVKTISQQLLFFPAGVDVLDVNKDQAQVIGQVELPAKNGFYPSLGHLDFKMKQTPGGELVPGTYVFVTSFAGDDRVAAFTSSVEDKFEQYTVNAEPSLHTTLLYNNSKQVPSETQGVLSLVDKVCYTNLIPGAEYVLEGKLMDKDTGRKLAGTQNVSKEFKPDAAHGCVEVVFEVDSKDLFGKTIVAFQKLFLEGELVADHADINNVNQTLVFPTPPTPPTPEVPPAPGEPLADSGGRNVVGLLALAAFAAGAGLLLRLRKKAAR